MTPLRAFIERHCARHPSACCPLADLAREFRATLPARDLAAWTRDRIAAELRSYGYAVGIRERVYFIGGLALAREWQESNGQLVAVAHS